MDNTECEHCGSDKERLGTQLVCPNCEGELEESFTLDESDDHDFVV